MPFEYKNQKNAEARETVDTMLLSMPSFCKTYVHAREGRISALSMLAYIQRINRFFDYLQENNSYFGNKKKTEIKLDDMEYLETEDIEEFAHWIRPAKESTVNNYLSAISSLYEHFCRKGKLKTNPVANVERGKKPPHEIIRLNEEQEKRFVNSVEHGTGLTTREQLYQQKTAMRDSAICLLLSRTGIKKTKQARYSVYRR